MNRFPLLMVLVCGLFVHVSGHNKVPAVAALPPPAKMKIILHGVSSGPNQAAIQPDAMPVLDEAARILQHGRPATVIVAGCINCSRDERSAATLARSVRDYLEHHGAAASRVESVEFAKRDQ